jgi:2,3-bisphosphoglycerate-dependent phosphoglycerate mutase
MIGMKTIYFVRHCTADGQHKDSPLTTVGMRQAHLLSVFLSEQNISVDKIISSPYLRAIESIKPYAEFVNKNIEIDQRLQERILSDEPIDDWMEVLEHSFNDHQYSLPGGESADDAIRRANTVLEPLYTNEHIKNIILVSHGNLLALLFQQFDKDFGFHQWKEMSNPDVFKLEVADQMSLERLWESY